MNRFCLFLFLILCLCACQETRTSTNPPLEHLPIVETDFARKQMFSRPIERAGRLVPAREVRLSFKTGGLISRIYVREGQSVGKGQILARLAEDELLAQQRQAEISVQQSQKEYDRLQRLFADTVITREQLEKGEALLESSKARLSAMSFNLGSASIVAPAQGRILRIYAEANELTAPGSPVLLFAPSQNQWHLKLQLTDQEGVRVQTGNLAEIRFDAFPLKKFPARIIQIDPIAHPLTGMVEVELQLTAAPDRLTSGLIGNAKLFPADSSQQWMIPADALVTGLNNEAYIFHIQGDSVHQLRLQIADFSEGYLVIRKGIDRAIEVVTTGKENLRSGQQVIRK